MKIVELHLNYDEIRKRIELDKSEYKPGEWAVLTGASKNVISNIHGKAGKHNPSLQYIIAVARATGKPIEWYLYGEKRPDAAPKVAEHQAQYKTEEEFMAQWPEEIRAACRQLKAIMLSNHPWIKPALLSNLAAFQYSVDKEKSQDEEIRKHKDAIRTQKKEIKELSKRLQFLEDRHKAKQDSGTEGAASSSTGKAET